MESDLTQVPSEYFQVAISWTFSKMLHDEKISNELLLGFDVRTDVRTDLRTDNEQCKGMIEDERKIEEDENGENSQNLICDDERKDESKSCERVDKDGDEKKEGNEIVKKEDKTEEVENKGGNELVKREEKEVEIEEEEEEHCPILEYLRSMIPMEIPIDTVSLRLNSLRDVEEIMSRFSELERMYLNTLCLYLYDYDKYVDMVRMFVEKHSIPIDYLTDHLTENLIENASGDQEGDEFSRGGNCSQSQYSATSALQDGEYNPHTQQYSNKEYSSKEYSGRENGEEKYTDNGYKIRVDERRSSSVSMTMSRGEMIPEDDPRYLSFDVDIDVDGDTEIDTMTACSGDQRTGDQIQDHNYNSSFRGDYDLDTDQNPKSQTDRKGSDRSYSSDFK